MWRVVAVMAEEENRGRERGAWVEGGSTWVDRKTGGERGVLGLLGCRYRV